MASNLNIEDIKIEDDVDKRDDSPQQNVGSEQFEDISLDFQNKIDPAPPRKNKRQRNDKAENQNGLNVQK